MADALQRDTIDNFFEDWIPEVEYGLKSNLAPQPEPRPEERPEPRIRPLDVPKPGEKRRHDGSKAIFILSALILLVGSLGVIVSYSEIYAKKAYIQELSAELDETKEMTVILSEESAQNMDMTELYRYATEELGMKEAGGNDIVFVHVSDHSYTQVSEPTQKEQTRVTFHWFP